MALTDERLLPERGPQSRQIELTHFVRSHQHVLPPGCSATSEVLEVWLRGAMGSQIGSTPLEFTVAPAVARLTPAVARLMVNALTGVECSRVRLVDKEPGGSP